MKMSINRACRQVPGAGPATVKYSWAQLPAGWKKVCRKRAEKVGLLEEVLRELTFEIRSGRLVGIVDHRYSSLEGDPAGDAYRRSELALSDLFYARSTSRKKNKKP